MTSTKFETKPLFTRRQLTALLLPLIAEQALSVTIGLADTLMVSSVGEAAVSGVSLVDTFNTLMIQIMTALATGGAVVASQYIGHREEKSARAAAAQIMFIMSSFSILVAAVVVVGRHAILRGIFGSIDADVMKYAETYFLLSALSYPFIGLYNAGAALFRAQGNSKISMMSSLVMNVVNIGGNAILIFGFKMGVMGAALASLVSRAVACCAVLFLLQKPDCMLRVTGLVGHEAGRKAHPAHPAGGHPGGHRERYVPNRQTVGGQPHQHPRHRRHRGQCRGQHHQHLPEHPGQRRRHGGAHGGGPVPRCRRERAGCLVCPPPAAGGLLRCLGHEPVGLLLRRPLGAVLVQPLAGASAMALEVMMWFNIVSLFFWPSSFTLPNILRAAGDASFTMTVSIVSMWVFRVGFCYLWVLKMGGGLLSIWMGMYLDWAFRSICFMVRFVRGKWLEQKVI